MESIDCNESITIQLSESDLRVPSTLAPSAFEEMSLTHDKPHFHVDEDYDDEEEPLRPTFLPGSTEVRQFLHNRAYRCVTELEIEAGLDTMHPPQWAQWTVRACFDDSCEAQQEEYYRCVMQAVGNDTVERQYVNGEDA